MKLLSIYMSHDGCISYIKDNKIIFHTQLDRYNRIKHSAIISKEVIDILKNIKIDVLLISYAEKNNSALLWEEVFTRSSIKDLKNIWINKLVRYEDKEHHLFHAYCGLTWNTNIKNIIVCDGTGKKLNNIQYENESFYTFKNKKLKHIKTYSNNIGNKYDRFSFSIFGDVFSNGKTMALSLHDAAAQQTQNVYEKEMFNFLKDINIKNKDSFLFTGGCAQNVLFNNKLLASHNNVFCDPFNGDFGISLGAANYYLNNKIKNNTVYLGIPQKINTDLFLNYKIISVNSDDVAKILLNEPVAIFQSRSEQGQRGLGNRSLLMSPINPNTNDKLNQIKKREWYRPFACSILSEKAKEWFDLMQLNESPYMMYVFKLLNNKQNILTSGVAINNTSRIQTVNKKQNINFYNLLKSFEKMTNIPILINTSLNMPGEVLVETLYDLKHLFTNSNLKYIYFPEINKLIIK